METETISEELCEVCNEEKQEGYQLDDLNVCLSCYSGSIDRDYDRLREARDLK